MSSPLTPRVSELIGKLVSSGAYSNASEAIEDAFDALVERDNFRALCAELDRADGQLEEGEFTEYDENTIHQLPEHIHGARDPKRVFKG